MNQIIRAIAPTTSHPRWKPAGLLITLLITLPCLACGSADEPETPASAGSEGEERAPRFELRRAALENLRLQTVEVGPQVLTGKRTYPGVVRYKESARAHLVSQVEGVVRNIDVRVGQRVGSTTQVCTLDSRELGQARARFLEALSLADFKEKMFSAEADLWAKKITSRDSYMRAEQDQTEARLSLVTAEQALRSLGLEDGELDRLRGRSSSDASGRVEATGPMGFEDRSLSQIQYTSPMDGEVIDVLVSRGEAVSPGQGILQVADLSTVWIDTRVPAHDLAVLEIGNPVHVRWAAAGASQESQLMYIAPEVDASSQTALVRIELPNPGGTWRPGLFVSVDAEVQRELVDLAVPTEALVADPDVPGTFLVFVQLKQGEYEATPITVLRTDGGFAAIEGNLHAGDRVVIGDTLFLKAVWLGEGGMEE
ncbi:Cobalt-zinc-cadmium resistance protein CzcB [Planctomycetes bacterium Poly30]|uniref:Cobalt-zinc-cadmium resistance protein CzcB n=1 Tax=Saltatorellus ferox TaxID=2528018 RepID=A0A518EM91_9BACT|nr:Cobalt-zinc-cadmium resistance protein CzcB [Planctomycetes bacterium Poly30]